MTYVIRTECRLTAGDQTSNYEWWAGPDMDHWSPQQADAYAFGNGPSAIRKQNELTDFYRAQSTGVVPQMEIVQAHLETRH